MMLRTQLSSLIKAFFLCLIAFPAWGSSLSGHPRVVDGDTLAFGSAKVRLFGIDAPEHDQTCMGTAGIYQCGTNAAKALKALIGKSPVICIGSTKDRYKRLIAICYLGMIDLNRWMVRNGYAVAYRKYSEAYIDVESQAKADHLNLWSGSFVMPWEFRHAQ